MATKVRKRRHIKTSQPKPKGNKLEELKKSKKKKTARLYKRKNSRVKDALHFKTPRKTKLT